MKFLTWSLLLCSSAAAAQLTDVKTVYVFPMASGFDQHLANRLTNDKVFQVVTDPKLADAVITDQVGSAFLYKLDHIRSTTPASDSAPHDSTFTHGRGTVFIVDSKSKLVLWSLYQKPKNNTPRELNKTAKRVVSSIEVAVAPPKDLPAAVPVVVSKPAAAPVTPPPPPAAAPAPVTPPPAPAAAPAPAPPKPAPPK
jgi:hypothetical protein